MRLTIRDLALTTLVIAGTLFFYACSSDDDPVTPQVGPVSQHSGSMILIAAAGEDFSMGSSDGSSDEQPVHTVRFTRSFWMDTTEVTQASFNAVMSAAYSAYVTPAWHAPYGKGDRIPAYLTEWGDAVLYCNARSSADGLEPVYSYAEILGTPGNGCELTEVVADLAKNGYRLPTEAEWEFAARAGGTSDFSWGKSASGYPVSAADSAEIAAHAVWAGNSWNLGSGDARFGMQEVAGRTANAFGLYDMYGNAWEWCHDWYDAAYYETAQAIDPSGPASGQWHTLRGGSWGNEVIHLRASNRTFSTPDYLFNFIGFRTVRNAD